MRCSFVVGFLCLTALWSQEIKPVPPPGIEISVDDRAQLEAGLAKLAQSLDQLRGNALVPDVLIFHKAVRYALEGNEFFKPDEVAKAKDLLRQGQERADALLKGQAPWTSATGLVVRGYISKIDGSVQPYGLVVPSTWTPAAPGKWRLDAWFHGRSETLSEVNFLTDRERNPGEFTPKDTIVLHLYGRYCNANKFAGEVDLFEALNDVKRHYAIDERRIAVRGFSMGGAAVWHIAAHHAGEWFAAAPGAGFAETPLYTKARTLTPPPTWWEEKLWHLYDATDYAANLFQCPIVAYNGDIDPQKQAADVMAAAMGEEGMRLMRITGPNTAHRYHPDSKVAINAIIDPLAERGSDPAPHKIRFTTWTLAYNRMKWVRVDALGKHWERARVDAEITDGHSLQATTTNVTALSFAMQSGSCPLDENGKVTLTLDAQKLIVPGPMSDRSWNVHLARRAGKWILQDVPDSGLHKRHGLQGPIDDAFMESFIVVRPSSKTASAEVAKWARGEQAHFVREWRKQFRGDAIMRDDTQVSDADIASSNLVLWGDPSSNAVLARIASKLPVQWTADAISIGNKRYPSADHALLMIYPNPLNPNKYVVLNSGFTFREIDYRSNAWQVPKLPDYAVVDVRTPADGRAPGKIVDAGFFGENWELTSNGGR